MNDDCISEALRSLSDIWGGGYFAGHVVHLEGQDAVLQPAYALMLYTSEA